MASLNNKIAIPAIIVLGAIAFLSGLYSQEFLKIDIRYALFTAEIGRYGLGMFPTLNGKPYTDYSSFPVLMMYLSSFKGSCINMLTVALPSAIMGIFTLVITYLIGERISKYLGAYAVLFSFLMYEYLSTVRSPSLDMYVTAATVFSFYLVYAADKSGKCRGLILVPLCFVFGFAARGPIGIIIPSAVVFMYYSVNRKWKRCIMCAVISGIFMALCLSAWFGFCYYLGGKELLNLLLRDQFFSRFGTGNSPWYYYFASAAGSYAVTYPLALVVVITYLKKLYTNRKDDNDEKLYLLRSVISWMLVILIIFSVPGYKHLRYVTSAMPAAALTASWIFLNFDDLKLFRIIKNLLLFVCGIIPFLMLFAVISGWIVLKIIKLNLEISFVSAAAIFLFFGALSFIVNRKFEGRKREFLLLAITTFTFIAAQIAIIDKINNFLESSRKFVVEVEGLKHKNKSQICFFSMGPDGDDLKYLINIPEPERHSLMYIFSGSKNSELDIRLKSMRPMFEIYGLEKLAELPPNTIFISKAKDFERLMPKEIKSDYRVIVEGKMGHQKCVAFCRNNQ